MPRSCSCNACFEVLSSACCCQFAETCSCCHGWTDTHASIDRSRWATCRSSATSPTAAPTTPQRSVFICSSSPFSAKTIRLRPSPTKAWPFVLRFVRALASAQLHGSPAASRLPVRCRAPAPPICTLVEQIDEGSDRLLTLFRGCIRRFSVELHEADDRGQAARVGHQRAHHANQLHR